MRGTLAALALWALVLTTTPVRAADTSRSFLADRGSVELLLLEGGWRCGLSADGANPGFSVFGGGAEVVLGLWLDLVHGIGLIASGKVFIGPRLDGVYLDGLGSLGAQLRLSDWVRLRAGIAAGQARLDRQGQATDYAILLGGFFAASVDLFRLGRERVAAAVTLRLDVDGHLVQGETFPGESLALTLGFGLRF